MSPAYIFMSVSERVLSRGEILIGLGPSESLATFIKSVWAPFIWLTYGAKYLKPPIMASLVIILMFQLVKHKNLFLKR